MKRLKFNDMVALMFNKNFCCLLKICVPVKAIVKNNCVTSVSNKTLQSMAVATILVLTSFVSSAANLPVIPGETPNLFGMTTPAGSGRHLNPPTTNICSVTSLTDASPDSGGVGQDTDFTDSVGSGDLRYCLEKAPSPKTVIFEYSGNIELQNVINIGGFTGNLCDSIPTSKWHDLRIDTGNYITIAGQTAPPPGITIINHGIKIERNCHDILIQHLRVRPGDYSLYQAGCDEDPPSTQCKKAAVADPLVLVGKSEEGRWRPPYNIVIANNSFSWGGDMNIQTGADEITFIRNISTEALANPLHPKGAHSKGFYALAYNDGIGAQNMAIVHNLISHSVDRNPTISAGSAIIANNLLYDLGPIGAIMVDDHALSKGPVVVSIEGNYFQRGLRDSDLELFKYRSALAVDDNGSKVYLGDTNAVDGEIVKGEWGEYFKPCNPWQTCAGVIPEQKIVDTRQDAIWIESFNLMTAAEAKQNVLANAGARPANRDSADVRAMSNVETGASYIIMSQSEVGGWPDLKKNRRETAIPSEPHAIQASGYTKLEEWLHAYASNVEKGPIPAPLGVKTAE